MVKKMVLKSSIGETITGIHLFLFIEYETTNIFFHSEK